MTTQHSEDLKQKLTARLVPFIGQPINEETWTRVDQTILAFFHEFPEAYQIWQQEKQFGDLSFRQAYLAVTEL